MFQKGGKRPDNSGRKKGKVNSATEEVRRLAKQHGPDAIKRLVVLMDEAKDERAQVAAANSILERAYGKASQVLGVDQQNNRIEVVIMGDDAKL